MKKDKLTPILVGMANTMFIICIVFLLTTSLFSTVYMTDETKIYFVSDSILRNLIFIMVAFALVYICSRLRISGALNRINALAGKIKWIIATLIVVMAVVWVVANQVIPGADQYELQKAAAELSSGNYATFEPGGYLDRYHFQCGYVLFICMLTPIIGTYNYLFWMLLNVAALIPLLLGIVKLCEMFKIEDAVQTLLLIILGAASPLIMYTTFPYGNILGLASIVWMVVFALKYIDKPGILYLFLSAALFVLALIFKGTYLIWGVAVLIYSIYRAIKDKNIKMLFLSIALILGYLFNSLVPISVCRAISGYDINQGVGQWAWLAMGLQEGGAAPGWWNGYNWYTYDGNGFNSEATNYVAKIVFRKRCAEFYHNIPYAFKFFWQKLASEWNNPTFQGFYYNSVREISNERCGIVDWILSNKGVHFESICLNFVQVNTLFGSLLYGMKKKKTDEDIRKMLFPIIFVGAFVFFTLWEAQAQNIWVFFILLIPYAIEGYLSLAKAIGEKKIVEYLKDNYVKYIFVGIAFILIVGVYHFMCPGCLTCNTAEYLELLK